MAAKDDIVLFASSWIFPTQKTVDLLANET
jgi:hypothetical protein